MLATNPGFSPHIYLDHCRVPSDWYESFSYYISTSEFLSVARGILPPSWTLKPAGIWVHASPSNVKPRRQGWKIHISALPKNALKILERSIQVCIDYKVPFKFLSDSFIFHTSFSKGSSRVSSGKFITIYPSDDSHFKLIADALHEKLSEFKGPYILSDKPYKGSQVVFYRYGAFSGYPRLSVFGELEILLRSPNGEFVPDGRSPFFDHPLWVSDPFNSDEANESDDASPDMTIYLKEGRYRIEEAIQFSVTGGVYKAIDMDSGKTVIIKESRPHTSVEPNGRDSIARLQKEHRLLTKLSGTGITPEPIDIFFDWEHLFLVEEYIPGDNFYSTISEFHFSQDTEFFREIFHTRSLGMAHAMKVAHDYNIIINDFSPDNVIISNDNMTFHLIDLESAWEEGVDAPAPTFGTFGYRVSSGVKEKLDDIYGFGAIVLSTLYSIANLIQLEPKAKHVFLDFAEREKRISKEMKTLLLECLNSDKKTRPKASEVLNRLKNISVDPTLPLPNGNVELNDALLLKTLDGTLNYIKSSIAFHRKDRLFPADPSVFITNPLSVAHGASGMAYALSYIEGKVPDKVISWMLMHEVSKDRYPPGLYLGLSGIAWVFWKLGLKELALKLMKIASDHPLLWDLSDVYYGATGFGLACLYFHTETKEAYWLEQATRVGDKLIKTKAESDKGFYWPDMNGNVWSGYARGASGISLFLLYLYLVTGDIRFKETGRCALDYDLGQVVELEDKMRIPRATSDSISPNHQNIYPHYLSDGSAGVCLALLRYVSVFGEDSDKGMIENLMPDATRNYTVFPTLFAGLAGLGNLQLDAFNFTGDSKYVSSAFYVTEGMLRFQIEKPEGIAFPGEQLYRISNDFGSGSSGIAMFLHRLINREKDLPNFMFTLDDLLCLSK